MKFIVSIIITALLAFAFCLYMPWWMVAVAAFLVAIFIYQHPLRSFLTGFCGIFLLWLVLVLTINSSNDGILARKISMVIGLGESSFTLVLITILIGGITGGLGALTGSHLRRLRNR
jgi:hypothetical protein